MYGRTFIFVENFHVNLSVVLEIFHVFNFHGTRYPWKLFNPKHFSIYSIYYKLLRNNDTILSYNV